MIKILHPKQEEKKGGMFGTLLNNALGSPDKSKD